MDPSIGDLYEAFYAQLATSDRIFEFLDNGYVRSSRCGIFYRLQDDQNPIRTTIPVCMELFL